MIYGFLDLFQRGDHRDYHQNIYKIGYISDFIRCITQNLLDTQIISACSIDNETKCEHKLIGEFQSAFDFRSDIGNEYFKTMNENDLCV
jgi:hypothetical protein